MKTRPSVGSISRLMQRSSVDLPEPDRPSTARNSPSRDLERDVVERAHPAGVDHAEALDPDGLRVGVTAAAVAASRAHEPAPTLVRSSLRLLGLEQLRRR